MRRLKVFPKRWSLKRDLILGFTVLALALVIPILWINFLPTGPAGVLGDGAGEEVTSEPTNPAAASENAAAEPILREGGSVASSVAGDERNPARAAALGIPGYVDVSFVDHPEELVLHRGEQWTGTVVLRLVSYTPDLTEVQINVDPQRSPGHYGRLIKVEGPGDFGEVLAGFQFIDFNAMLSYSPSGAFAIKAGESLTFSLTIQIPEDFPEELDVVHVDAVGIWADNPIWSDTPHYVPISRAEGGLKVIVR